ncbi:bifunctional riboflavin kinase/FAD synthetase [Mechercharimyces sp. CAU 1602]|uniref:bifunctional riboflavin kinase/FAD synthetase n=1 Tax=Mechercharimyces sp. CAU 1602 TaxID=2973933 RepID=UPI002162DEBA|nr:bifunctional riboflavin kinase/FAD synthetase [Mechercharimyces sp. CAU 1602]MCS1351272.1 bifunctional riboflavin kinase/FAD synthetase [Mechercharimyces sp. CAU 1602]
MNIWRSQKKFFGMGKVKAMETIRLSYPLTLVETIPPVALAIGFFDGVHKGHQAVVREGQRLAAELGVQSAVMTFDPHPREVLGREKHQGRLTPLDEKLKQLEQLGVDRVYVMTFDLSLANLSREGFVKEILIPLQVRGVSVGFNFTFGRHAAGKAADLIHLGEHHFVTRVQQPIQSGGITLSSTRLRQALAEGDMAVAEAILGRSYSFTGTVVSGDQRGRTIGFPTANLSLTDTYWVPRLGVYVVEVMHKGEKVQGMMNIGMRPTFKDVIPKQTLEVHLFDFEGDLYGETLEVHVLHFLREEKRFPSVDHLVSQLQTDERQARAWLREK